ncbi:Multiple RNA-binding domain-containing protein [Drosera capensis]
MKGGKILSTRIKKHMKNGKNVSMGFGFVEFDSMDTAASVCQDLQGTVLDGHALILQHCRAKEEKKVLKKNKSIRLPKKFGNHRGFAFVGFMAKQEAENALRLFLTLISMVCHLVLERAMEGETRRNRGFGQLLTKTTISSPTCLNSKQDDTIANLMEAGKLDKGSRKKLKSISQS